LDRQGEGEPKLGRVVGLFADVHGSLPNLTGALERCRAAGVETIALLGDLFDRVEQADPCARAFAGWHVTGVWGNHEREIALAAAELGVLDAETVKLLQGLNEEMQIEDEVCFAHDVPRWGPDPLARMFGRTETQASAEGARITFAGHTHFRSARSERGPIDVARGSLTLDPVRRYLINPGALAVGQFAIWDRDSGVVTFRQVEWR
jgi:predicted phosphodiesterase